MKRNLKFENPKIRKYSYNTWILVNLPSGSKPIGCKYIFKKKKKFDGSIDKYKARLLAKGFKLDIIWLSFHI